MSEKSEEPPKKRVKNFISEYSSWLTIGLIILGILLTLLFIFVLKKEARTTINVLSIIGTMASVFGLTIAYIQIIAIKEISVITQMTVHDTKDKLILGLSISDVTEAISYIGEIERTIGLQKHEIARMRIKDLKAKLIQFKYNKEFNKITPDNRIREIIAFLDVHSTNLYLMEYGEIGDVKYDPEPINKCLLEISTYLNEFKNGIKYNTV